MVGKRGYYPAGGGEVRVAVEPSVLRPVSLDEPGGVVAIEGRAHVARLPIAIAQRMRDAALGALSGVPGAAPCIESVAISDEMAAGHGGAIVVWARTEQSVLGASAVAERGVRAETLGESVGAELAADLASGAGLDMHAADQLLVYLALAGGGSFTTRTLTTHARTAMWLIESFLPIRFIVREAGALVHVAAVPTPPV
jgi:RNA 3'-terminal phosphate cyclase (ATP)